jgi:hypothetical protein
MEDYKITKLGTNQELKIESYMSTPGLVPLVLEVTDVAPPYGLICQEMILHCERQLASPLFYKFVHVL